MVGPMLGGKPELLGGRLSIGDDFLARLELGLQDWAMLAALNGQVCLLIPTIDLRLNPTKG